MTKKIVNKPAAKKRGNPNWVKGGKSPNPAGAPRRGESWAEIIKRVGEYTPGEAAERSLQLAKQLISIGDGVTLKEAVVMRVFGALLFEPQPGLLNAFMDRTEGKVSQPVEINDLREKADNELIAEFHAIIDAARARTGGGDNGGTEAAQNE